MDEGLDRVCNTYCVYATHTVEMNPPPFLPPHCKQENCILSCSAYVLKRSLIQHARHAQTCAHARSNALSHTRNVTRHP